MLWQNSDDDVVTILLLACGTSLPATKPCICATLIHTQWLRVSGYQVSVHLGDSTQARSQDRFWGGAGPPKSGPFGPKKWTFLNLTPPYPPTKTPFLAHFVAKSGPFGRFGGVHRTPRTPPPGYGPDSTVTYQVPRFLLRLHGIEYLVTRVQRSHFPVVTVSGTREQ